MDIIINGAGGRMGGEVALLAKERSDISEVLLVDRKFENDRERNIYKTIFDCGKRVGAIIDFSFHTSAPSLCAYAVKTRTPLVIATTGHTERERAMIRAAASHIPLFFSPNVSSGALLAAKLSNFAATELSNAQIDIVETHHSQKADAPSATALMLAEAIREARPQSRLKFERGGARGTDEICVHSLRLGNAAGSHEVIFALPFQTLTIRHEVHDRRLFAEGALDAAFYISNKEPGMFG